MIKKLCLIVVLLANTIGAQEPHEVYLFDFIKNDSTNTYTIKNPINISDNNRLPCYNSQLYMSQSSSKMSSAKNSFDNLTAEKDV